MQAATYRKAVTKIAGNGNYAVYRHASRKGPSGQFTTTKYFRHGQIQSKHSRATKKGEYWQIIVDGRTVGWVSEKFFVRNQISVAKHARQVGATAGNFVTNSPVQGFAYGNVHFYIGYNDYLFKVASDGKAEQSYHFRTRRETEGLYFAGSRLYLGLAQRAELLSARQ